jgi:hypothetical protein
MSDINIYPFTRKIVLEQKTEAQQNALLAGTNRTNCGSYRRTFKNETYYFCG